METDRIEYLCKKCGWRKSILAAWADLRPKKCMNKKCNCSFILNPDYLGVVDLANKAPNVVDTVTEPVVDEVKLEQSRRMNYTKKGK